jgi:hypothetical protein
VNINTTVFWNVTPYSLIDSSQRFIEILGIGVTHTSVILVYEIGTSVSERPVSSIFRVEK